MWIIIISVFVIAFSYLGLDAFQKIKAVKKGREDYELWLDSYSEIRLHGGTILAQNKDLLKLQGMGKASQRKLVDRQRSMIRNGWWKIIEEDGERRIIDVR
jgi:hypothetical protein